MLGLFKKRKKKIKENDKVEILPKEDVKPTKVEENPQEEMNEIKEEPKEEKKRKVSNHITKHPQGGWQIKKSGSNRALKRFRTQKEAIEFAKGLEETTGTAYVIHKADGKTRKKTY